jgi:hypothetical protein
VAGAYAKRYVVPSRTLHFVLERLKSGNRAESQMRLNGKTAILKADLSCTFSLTVYNKERGRPKKIAGVGFRQP